ncbi:3-oxoacyl-ACP synthase [Flagellimonas halotolerans]|uniref:3-oxoacyl-ACP synthase n=1 Tax=Flagellimonas halotolerans TaxID=3112164 RepID=A0ABU6IL55_9FLAO|nr:MULTISPECIES: 3-oxoacyl-ACP synthase [unclassified Allomuricauda]MEC3963894.1 3-oxoacyl-ACP synthase [Muricauda sp. SYSU M86414]MEC4263764.1 3-oxoacyl-ACP synthase [Muricauda sp. SYSU M84420]
MKKALLDFCWSHLDERTERLKKQGDELRESLGSETKSSAGDKHETGRAMVQLEQEKLGQQLLELDATRSILNKINIDKLSAKICLGSLVKTSVADYFIAISAGAFKYTDGVVYCISANAPIARLLLGKEKGENFVFNGNAQSILEVI